jgi:hypothetical protein
MRTHESLQEDVKIKISVPPQRALAYPAEGGAV